jgi:hypothetical protein
MAASLGGTGLGATGMTTPQAIGLLGTGMKMMGGSGQQQAAPPAPSMPAPQPMPRPRLKTYGQ